MLDRTRRLWAAQDQHHGDRHRLVTAVSQAIDARRVLYPGSFVDLAPSFVWPAVTYIDTDRRAGQFFGDEDGIRELLAGHGVPPGSRDVRFIAADYTRALDLDDGVFDLLLSLYAGFVSEHCTRHLRVGGTLPEPGPIHPGEVARVNAAHGIEILGPRPPRSTTRRPDERGATADADRRAGPGRLAPRRLRRRRRLGGRCRTRPDPVHRPSRPAPTWWAGADPDECLAAAAGSEGGPPEVDGGPPHLVEGMWAELVVD